MIRGESKSIAFGLLEDDPWQEGSGERTRWEYKDWGNNNNITPGSVVRIEGASVNEYQGRMSLNINQSSRIAVLREGCDPVVAPGEPVDIATLPSDGYVCVVGRLMSSVLTKSIEEMEVEASTSFVDVLPMNQAHWLLVMGAVRIRGRYLVED